MGNVDLRAMGERIQTRRKQLGYTQEQLADRLDVSIQMVSNLERGNKAIRIDNLVRLGELLQVSTDYLLTGHGSERDFASLAEKIAGLPEQDRRLIEVLADHCTAEAQSDETAEK